MKVKRAKSTSTVRHYVTNGVLLPAFMEAKAQGKVTDKLIRMIQMIAERYSRKSNFIGYSYRDDMVSAAVMNLCNNALKFNPEKSSNPFAYYTTSIHNSFLQYMADEKKHRNVRDALLIDAGANPSFSYQEAGDDASKLESDDFEITDTKLLDADDIPVMSVPSELLPDQKAKSNKNSKKITVVPKPSKPSFNRQVFTAMDPGKPGKNKLSKHKDLNPGEVKVYKPSDWIQDPVTGKVTLKHEMGPAVEIEFEMIPEVKKKKTAKRKAKTIKAAKKKSK